MYDEDEVKTYEEALTYTDTLKGDYNFRKLGDCL